MPASQVEIFRYLDPDGIDFTFNGDFAFDDHGSVETYGVNFKLVKSFGDIDFTSVADYKDYERQQWIDVVHQSTNSQTFRWMPSLPKNCASMAKQINLDG